MGQLAFQEHALPTRAHQGKLSQDARAIKSSSAQLQAMMMEVSALLSASAASAYRSSKQYMAKTFNRWGRALTSQAEGGQGHLQSMSQDFPALQLVMLHHRGRASASLQGQ